MLLESCRLKIFNSACQPGIMAVHCFAHLDQDVRYAAGLAEAYHVRITVLNVIEKMSPNTEMLMTAPWDIKMSMNTGKKV